MSKLEKHFYEFGPFRVDTAERLLIREGNPVPLPPKVYDTLLILLRNAGHTLEKEKLIRELWPDTFVEEGNLAQNISVLRKALSNGGDERYIATVPRRGYRFIAAVFEETEREIEKSDAVNVAKPEIRELIISKRGWGVIASAVVGAFFVCVVAYLGVTKHRNDSTVAIHSLAILPLHNPSDDRKDAYLDNG